MGIGVKVRVWGKYALFSRPDIVAQLRLLRKKMQKIKARKWEERASFPTVSIGRKGLCRQIWPER